MHLMSVNILYTILNIVYIRARCVFFSIFQSSILLRRFIFIKTITTMITSAKNLFITIFFFKLFQTTLFVGTL